MFIWNERGKVDWRIEEGQVKGEHDVSEAEGRKVGYDGVKVVILNLEPKRKCFGSIWKWLNVGWR